MGGGFTFLYHGTNYPEFDFTGCESAKLKKEHTGYIISVKELYFQPLKYFRGSSLHYKFAFVSENVVRGKGCASFKNVDQVIVFLLRTPSKMKYLSFKVSPEVQ